MSIAVLARTLADEVDSRPLPVSPVPIILVEDDEPASSKSQKLGFAEGQSFVIEYTNAAGRSSTRRITVYSLLSGAGGVPSLVARCHERKAQRQFRIDRIKCFIDYDGEVFGDVPAFLAENFGMHVDLASRRQDDDGARWMGILDAVRHDSVLLAALARSDGRTVAAEVDEATDYLSRMAERQGLMLSEAEILSIYRYANRLRPTEDAILRALEHVSVLGKGHVERLLVAAARVIDADGQRHPSEIALLNAIAEDLTGAPLF